MDGTYSDTGPEPGMSWPSGQGGQGEVLQAKQKHDAEMARKRNEGSIVNDGRDSSAPPRRYLRWKAKSERKNSKSKNKKQKKKRKAKARSLIS